MKFIKDITNFIFIENQLEKADIIFIPGGSYPEIAETAAILWKNGYAPKILPSGKYSVKRGFFPNPLSKSDIYTDHYKTEWDFLNDVLLKNGVNEDVILRENEAQNTYDNAFLSRELTDSLEMNIEKAIICCKSFHARRCFMYYQWAYPNTDFLIYPTDVQNITKDSWHLSLIGRERVMDELTKSGAQFKSFIMDLPLG